MRRATDREASFWFANTLTGNFSYRVSSNKFNRAMSKVLIDLCG
jgi:hypothetical protein